MVFGWKKRRDPGQPSERTIPLRDVGGIVSELQKARSSQAISEIVAIRDRASPLIGQLIEIGRLLESDDLRVDDLDRNISVIVVRGKKQVIDVMKKDVRPLPEVTSIGDAEDLERYLGQMLKKLGDVLGRQTRVIHIFAKKYANQLKDNLEVISSNHAEIRELLKNHASGAAGSKGILDLLSEIESARASREERQARIAEIRQEADDITRKTSSLEQSISEARSSEGYKRYLALRDDLGGLSETRSRIRAEIDAQFAKISRPLGRYEYGSSLDRDQKAILEGLVENPIDVMLEKNRDSIIVILENVRKGIASGSISVKDTAKSLSLIAETQESVDGFIARAEQHAQRARALEQEADSARPAGLAGLERDLKKCVTTGDDLALRLEAYEGELDEIGSRIPDLIRQVQDRLRALSNTRYVISD